MGSPRVDVVFRLRQCDKENHGWREGPPLTVACKRFDLLAGPSPSRQNRIQTKKEYCSTRRSREHGNRDIGRL